MEEVDQVRAGTDYHLINYRIGFTKMINDYHQQGCVRAQTCSEIYK